jgi:hypothetical protein
VWTPSKSVGIRDPRIRLAIAIAVEITFVPVKVSWSGKPVLALASLLLAVEWLGMVQFMFPAKR